MTKVGLIGAGNFGFALMYHLDRKQDDNLSLCLYDRNPETVAHIQRTHTHPRYFPTVELSEKVVVTDDLSVLMTDCQVLILAMVSTATTSIIDQIRSLITSPLTIVSVMKALDQQTGRPLTDTISQAVTDLPVTLAVLAGGTTGTELTQEQYLGATLACTNDNQAPFLADIISSPYLRLQLSHDVLGVQYAGSLKNLISVLVGLVTALGFSYGTQTHVLSLAASECERLAVSLGADRQTFSFASQCWGNDMVMSATNSATRNHQFGLLLGQGHRYQEAVDQMAAAHKTAESVHTIAILPSIADLDTYPLLHFLVQLSQQQATAHQIVNIIENYH